ncbi:MAG: decaprenyl-phosphate phosphoribosyltransferase [Ignavibacteriaceae bacterium]|nr:decaprenyl-phosphate phosphoribosyltransferase [Ignavibacteriaceae bacterium]
MKLFKFLRLIRVHQWIKNVFVFIPLLFSLHLFDKDYFITTLLAFLVFCLASSTIYVINDLVDIESDRAHPVKKDRPLPSGAISQNAAIITASLLLVLVFWLMMYFNWEFILLVMAFVVLNVLYSFWLKNVVLLDVFSIAAGFSIRVLAGAFVIQVPISSWLLLTTMFISLFLGVMKRRSELVLFTEKQRLNLESTEQTGTNSRKVLAQYSLNFADQMATIAATGVIVCYALYTVAPRTVSIFNTERLIYTTPFVVFGIFRFMYLEYISGKGENTTHTLATDIPMIVNVLLYAGATIMIIYKLF